MLTSAAREGPEVRVPVATVRGAEEGPTLVVVAGVHGSEYVGIHATRLLYARTDAGTLRGTLVTVPVFGVPAFYGLAAHTSPVDGADPGASFPGDPEGTHTQRAAHLVWEHCVVAEGATAVIDVHGGDLEEELVEYTQVTRSGNAEVDEAGESLARALGFPLFVRAPQPSTTPGSLFGAAAAVAGIPGVLAEGGSHGVLDFELAETYYGALRGALVHLGMVEGELPGTRDAQLLYRFEGVRAPVEGFWLPSVKKGERIRKGQKIGEMQDLFGEHLADVQSDEDAVVLGVITTPARERGAMLVGLATLEE